jgi:hypothetical protein
MRSIVNSRVWISDSFGVLIKDTVAKTWLPDRTKTIFSNSIDILFTKCTRFGWLLLADLEARQFCKRARFLTWVLWWTRSAWLFNSTAEDQEMPAYNEPRHPKIQSQRSSNARAEAQAALMTIVREAERRGWLPIETAVALADAADDLVYDLYGDRPAAN